MIAPSYDGGSVAGRAGATPSVEKEVRWLLSASANFEGKASQDLEEVRLLTLARLGGCTLAAGWTDAPSYVEKAKWLLSATANLESCLPLDLEEVRLLTLALGLCNTLVCAARA